eukprot:GGOE01060633.1.p1 GENE.GGOE01060633.1~~GGOE01060633.1.p1  ORF type:complete len:143 (+),score=9.33 GGOE01060633.1:49-429(+)
MTGRRPRHPLPPPVYICAHITDPPADQVIRTDTENLLLRYLRMRRLRESPSAQVDPTDADVEPEAHRTILRRSLSPRRTFSPGRPRAPTSVVPPPLGLSPHAPEKRTGGGVGDGEPDPKRPKRSPD